MVNGWLNRILNNVQLSAGDHNSSVVTMSLDTIEDTVLPEKLAASEQYQEDKKTKDNLISGLIFGESKRVHLQWSAVYGIHEAVIFAWVEKDLKSYACFANTLGL